ncbi:DUF92 domain-containing protein [Rossellomorea aquimaris]|uniref:DUF92 domain-containing protein n=1 Tax=Rossellomorea aquimaris TaxID=189382 RepID=UPI001653836D|nr:DUF92 domain-containing protein [Rossellomorea aquimaris]
MINEYFFLLLIIFSIAIAGWKTSNLSLSGAVMAIMVGMAIGWSYGFEGLFILGVFFLSSSIWSRLFKKSKIGIEERLAKTSIRDWQQVLANGGPAALFALFFSVTGNEVWTLAFIASIAGANADTWASEIGPLSHKMPFSIRTFRRVPKGTSGAVSVLGTVAAFFGAALISLASLILLNVMDVSLLVLLLLSGFLGNILDTVLGAFIQLEYRCTVCDLRTESSVHCDHHTERTKGVPLMNNETVNALSSLFAGVLMLIFY